MTTWALAFFAKFTIPLMKEDYIMNIQEIFETKNDAMYMIMTAIQWHRDELLSDEENGYLASAEYNRIWLRKIMSAYDKMKELDEW